MSTSGQRQEELAVFRRFVQVCPLPICLDSVESRSEPEPDIRCALEDHTVLAFELTEILDKTVARRRNAMYRALDTFRNLISDLSAYDRGTFNCRYRDAVFLVSLTPGSSGPKRNQGCRALMTLLLEDSVELLSLGDYETVVIPKRRNLSSIQNVRVLRGLASEPRFDVSAGGFFVVPAIDKISAKFKKRYQCDCPIELLAYFDGQPKVTEELWLPALVRFMRAEAERSQFRRIWVYDNKKKRILTVHPEVTI